MYETIFSPVNYGGLELKNRIIFACRTKNTLPRFAPLQQAAAP